MEIAHEIITHNIEDFIEDLCVYFPDACRVSRESKWLLPRDISALMTSDEYDSYLKTPIHAENEDHVPFDFLVGLPVPVTWINNMKNDMLMIRDDEKHEFSVESVEAFNKKARSIFESRNNIDPYGGGPGYSLVPGISGDSWCDIDKGSFLLGLYIFDKKFADLKRFVECKKMEDILLFYYAEFCKSTEYMRWSSCRKVKSRKCVYGERIFTGLSQRKLLSRLRPQVSEACSKALLEVSNKFRKSKLSLVDYVSSIKGLVGMTRFVEAVAIGKGKHDLTGMAVETVTSNKASHMRQKIPTGKAYAALTHTEIIKFLTGGYRLSKSRSSGLFWEAVWPRLSSRGWHFEQQTNEPYVPGAKCSMVFLRPGINKFSKRELKKGNHYFDSITDVLSKVSSEPELIELDIEKYEGNRKEENGWIDEEKKEHEELPEKQRHCYLQPRTPRCSTGVMKCTIVDTSLANGKLFKLRELRNLPMQISKTTNLTEETGRGTSEISTKESDCAGNMLENEVETNSANRLMIPSDRGMSFDMINIDSSSSDQLVQIGGLDSTDPVKKSKRQNKLYDAQSHLSEQPKEYDLDNLPPVPKRHRTITASSNEETSSGRSSLLVAKFGEDLDGSCSDSHDREEKAVSEMGSSQERLSLTCAVKGCAPPSTGCAQDDYNCHENPEYVPHLRRLNDLNLPAQPFKFENGAFMTDSKTMQDDMTHKQHEDSLAPETSLDVSTLPQQPDNMTSQRRSTRNRPPTARALEALADGYLTTQRRKKD